MNVVLRIPDMVAIYRGDDLVLDEAGLKGGFGLDLSTTTKNAVLTQVQEIPGDWIGGAYSYADGVWTLVDGALIPKPSVPRSVRRKQGKQAILMSGHWPALMSFVDGLPEPSKTNALFELNDSETYERDDAFLIAAAAGIGLTDADLDQLFIIADTM